MNRLRHLRLLATSCSLAALLAATSALSNGLLPATAEQLTALPAPRSEQAGPVASAAPDQVELAALYYYAREGHSARVEAETRRLQGKYPDFTVPSDLYQMDDRTSVDETPLWNLYKQNDFAGIDVEIVRMAEKNPGWSPSEDFTSKLARARLRLAMTESHERRDWQSILTSAQAMDPATDPDIDLLWLLIEANRARQRPEALAAIYQGILYRDAGSNPFSPQERLATLQKAAIDFPPSEVRKALAALELPSDLNEQAEALTRDLFRREVAEFNSATERTEPLPTETVDPLRRNADVTDMTLLGWYALKINRAAEAETWFRRALDRKPDAENIKGLYLSLVHDNREPEARELVVAHLPTVSEDSEFMLEVLHSDFSEATDKQILPAVVEAYSAAIQRSQSPENAEILGWYAYNAHQFEAAAAWFSKSWEWKKTATALKGLVLASVQLKDKNRLKELKSQYAGEFPQVFADLKTALPPKGHGGSSVATPSNTIDAGYVADFKAKRYGDCVTGIQRMEARGAASADARLVKGWCLLELNHLTEARAAFGSVAGNGGKAAQDAAYGLALTLMRSQLIDDAEALLMRFPLTAAHDREIRSEIYWQRARAAFDAKQYQSVLNSLNLRLQLAPEPMDMSRLRGWSHYHLGHRAEARAIFTRLNMLVGDSANRQALAIINGQ